MKKMLFLILLAGYSLIGAAGDPISWVESNEGKIIVKKIIIKDTKAKLILEDGTKKIIPCDRIKSFTLNGKVFKRLPLYTDGKFTGKMVFMELVKIEGDLNLYRYLNWSYPNVKITNYLLYREDRLCMEFDEK